MYPLYVSSVCTAVCILFMYPLYVPLYVSSVCIHCMYPLYVSSVCILYMCMYRQVRAMILSISFILPWVITFFLGPLVNRYGVYRVIATAFVLKALLSATALLVGHSRMVFVGLFAVCSRVLTECVCRHTPIVLADLVRPHTLVAEGLIH